MTKELHVYLKNLRENARNPSRFNLAEIDKAHGYFHNDIPNRFFNETIHLMKEEFEYSNFKRHSLDEMLAAPEWSKRAPGEMHGVPIRIDEQQAIKLALEAICDDDGYAWTNTKHFLRPIYRRQLLLDGGLGEWRWEFWFPYPLPDGFEHKAGQLFVYDPTGVVEFGDVM